MKRLFRMSRRMILIGLFVLFLDSCGGSGGGAGIILSKPTTTHFVTLAWAPNHEKNVNSTGGGYLVSIGSQTSFDVPYTAPTSTTVVLKTGTYTVKVQAFAALDAQGGSTGSLSAPSTITVRVP